MSFTTDYTMKKYCDKNSNISQWKYLRQQNIFTSVAILSVRLNFIIYFDFKLSVLLVKSHLKICKQNVSIL